MEEKVRQLEVIRIGHPVLRDQAKEVPEDWFGTDRLIELSRSLVHTMLEKEGVGLAAPQVGESLQIFAYCVPAAAGEQEILPMVLVNPEVRPMGTDVQEAMEGCLSVPGLRGMVPRNRRIKVKARLPSGETLSLTADGFHARVIQHEYDHLAGIIFLDRMTSMSTLGYEEELAEHGVSDQEDWTENGEPDPAEQEAISP